MALLTLPDNSHVFAAAPPWSSCSSSALCIGILHGLLITKVGIPSFVVTLAGLLGWNGVVLLLIGDRGTVIVQNSFFVGFANDFLPSSTAWILAIAGVALYAGMLFWQRAQRVRHGLATAPDAVLALRVVGLAIAVFAVVYVCNKDRGIPYVLLMLAGVYILWTYVLNRTRFGRHIYAVGGNTEAARRAGINVDNIKIACFAICSMMAALGGIVLASRLRSVDTAPAAARSCCTRSRRRSSAARRSSAGAATSSPRCSARSSSRSIDNGLGLLGSQRRHEVRHHRRRAAAGGHGRLGRAQGARVGGQSVMAGGLPRPLSAGARPASPHHHERGLAGEQGGLDLMPLRWGILSTAKITDKLLDSGTDQEFVAVGSRDGARAEAYAREKGIARAHGSYEALLADPDVDAIYNPLPNSMHVEWLIRALEAGKHVLCEKPLTRHPEDVDRVFDVAQREGRVLTEASCGAITRRWRAPASSSTAAPSATCASFARTSPSRRRTPTTSACRPRLMAAASWTSAAIASAAAAPWPAPSPRAPRPTSSPAAMAST